MVAERNRPTKIALALLCGILLAAIFLSPTHLQIGHVGEFLTRQTARVAVLFWSIAVALLLMKNRLLARWVWTLACAAYLVHVATAFDRIHGWSHEAAFRHVEEVSGYGPGIFVSYGFSLLWLVDVLWWEFGSESYERRPIWLDRVIHVFFAFLVFNGTVVYETGFIRWAGIAIFLLLGILFVCRFMQSTNVSGFRSLP